MLPVRRSALLLALVSALAVITPTGAAGATIYYEPSSFAAATTGLTTIDFESLLTPASLEPSVTIAGATFGNDSLYVLPDWYYGYSGTSNYLSQNASASPVTVAFASPVRAFAMDLGYLWNFGGAANPSDVTFALSNGETLTLAGIAPCLLYQAHPMAFVGFTTETSFSGLTITSATRMLAFDNVQYGAVAAEDPGEDPAPVPEPASLLLLGSGLAGTAVARRRRSR